MSRVIWTPTLYLRRDKDKQKLDGSYPVYVHFQRIGRKEPKFSIGLSFKEDEWDDNARRPKDLALKIIIDKKVARIEQQILNAVANDVEITHDLLKRFVSNKDEAAANSFFGYFNEYVQRQAQRGKMRDSTRTGYEVTYRLLREYRKEIKIADINAQLLGGFDKFLVERGRASGKGDVKGGRGNHHRHINAVLHYIATQGVSVQNPYDRGDVEIPQTDANNVFLDFDELRAMMGLADKLPLETRWYRVLMMYLFACTTGMRISDTRSLKWGEVDLDDDKMLIKKIAKKTKREFVAPIFESAAELLAMSVENIDNVEADLNVFYKYSPQTINNTLKELAELADIDKPIAFHSARRTCATLLAAEGADPIFIRDILGHKSLTMTNRYIKTSETLTTLKAKKIDVFSTERLGLKKD